MGKMRSAVALFGLVCGLIVIWTVGNYGYASADDPAAKWNMAFLFGVIAAGGLFGHAVAVRIWRISKFWSLAIYLVCGGALVINLSNSLGALAGRNSRSEAEASSKVSVIRDDRAELARLQKALERLGSYVATDQTAVDAAKRATDAATTAKERECGNGDPKQRGRFCRDKEDAEATAAKALKEAAAAKSLTDRATRIEADMRPIRERLRLAGPVQEANVQGNALAKLFRLPDAEAGFVATLQQFGLAAIVELLIVLSMVAFELMGRDARPKLGSEPRAIEPQPKPELLPVVAFAPVVPARPRPRLAAAVKQPLGAALDFLQDGLEIVIGPRLEMTDAFIGYSDWCGARALGRMGVADFVEAMEGLCAQFGIRVQAEDDRHYILNMRLADAKPKTAAPKKALGPMARKQGESA
jgi:hypothetical protein